MSDGFEISVECLRCGSFSTELLNTPEGIKGKCNQCDQVGDVFYEKSLKELVLNQIKLEEEIK